jgi:hypothetical protein
MKGNILPIRLQLGAYLVPTQFTIQTELFKF